LNEGHLSSLSSFGITSRSRFSLTKEGYQKENPRLQKGVLDRWTKMNEVISEKSSICVDEEPEYSPTRVSDIEGRTLVINPASPSRKNISSSDFSGSPKYRLDSPVREELAEPELAIVVTPHRRNSTKMFLPTLEESSVVSSSSEVSETKREEEKQEVIDEVAKEVRQKLFLEDLKEGAPYRGMTANQKEVYKLKLLATQLASQGKEEDAIKVYQRALRLMKADLGRIKRNLQKIQSKPPQTRGGAEQLHEEWMQLATTLAEIRTIMAILYERLGEYDQAVASCEEAKDVYESYARLVARNGITDTNIDEYAGQMDNMLDRLRTAKSTFEDRKRLHQTIIECRVKISNCQDENDKEAFYKEAFNLLNEVLNMERSSLGETHPQVADTLRIFATLYFDKGQVEHALETTEDAVAIMKLCLGPTHPRTALALRSLAKIHEMSNRSPEDMALAVRYYNEAIGGFKAAFGHNHALVGETLNNVAVIHIQRGEYDAAVEKLSDALIAYETVADGGSSINPAAAQVWKNLGECYTRQREWENAHFAYTSALEVHREARRGVDADTKGGSPSSSGKIAKAIPKGSDDASLADTLLRLGKATKETGRHDDSYRIYKEGLRIFRRLYQESKKLHSTKTLAKSQDRLAHTMYCIAEVQEIRGNYDDAMKLYTESLNLRLNSDANRSVYRVNMVHCAMALAGIGSVHMMKREIGDACDVFAASLGYLKARLLQAYQMSTSLSWQLRENCLRLKLVLPPRRLSTASALSTRQMEPRSIAH
jgi:tetratricopeptide (TPR) repeat protein